MSYPADSHPDRRSEAILEQLYPRVGGYVAAHVACHEDAEEVTNDVLYKVSLRLDGTLTHFIAYALRAAYTTVVDYYRRTDRQREWVAPPPFPEDEEGFTFDEWLSYLAEVDDPRQAPPESNEELLREILDCVQLAADSTADPHANVQIFPLAGEGYKNAEIAKHLCKTEASVRDVKSRMRETIEALHPEWAQDRTMPGPKRGARHGRD